MARVMSDAKLAELGQDYRRLKSEEKAAKVLAEFARDRLLVELERRGTKSIDVKGVRVQRKAKRLRSFDVAALKKKLNLGQRRVVVREVVVHAAVDELVKAGLLETELVDVDGQKVTVVAGCETVEYSAPYIDVTFTEKAA